MTIRAFIGALHRILSRKVGLVPEIVLYVIIICAGFIMAYGPTLDWLR